MTPYPCNCIPLPQGNDEGTIKTRKTSSMKKNKRLFMATLAAGLAATICLLFFWHSDHPETPDSDPKGPAPLAAEAEDDDLAWRQMQERLKIPPEEKAEAQRLANWKANFPYPKTYHPAFRFDRQAHFNINDENAQTGPKFAKWYPVIQAHRFMASFYESEARFSKGFEQLYHILKEYDCHDNPMQVAWIFSHLADYHQAAPHNPETVITYTRSMSGKFHPDSTAIMEEVPQRVHRPNDPENTTQTWGEWRQMFYDGHYWRLV